MTAPPTYDLDPQIFYAGGYHSIAADRIAAAGVSYTRGVTDDLDLLKGNCKFRVLDDDDTYRPTNPESALYGIIGPYLPMVHSVDGVHRFAGEIEQLEPGQTDDHQTAAGVTTKGLRWVDFTSTGPIGTVGRWRDVVASPLFTQIKTYANLRSFFPGEDGSDASVMSSAYPGVPAARVSGVTFGAADGPSGSNKLLQLGSAGDVSGAFGPGISTTAYQLSFSTDMAGADGSERQVFYWLANNGCVHVWSASLTTYRFTVVDAAGNQLVSDGVGNGGAGPGENITFRFKMSRSGSTWTCDQAWYAENDQVIFGTTSTFTAGAGAPTGWRTSANTVMSGAYFGQLYAVTSVADDLLSSNQVDAINGYPGETTADRFRRILDGRGIPLEILGDEDQATQMGPQTPLTVKAQLQDIRQTEQGLIFESPDGRGLRLALRNYLYEQAATPALELTYPDDIAPGFAELATATELYNTIIAKDRSGISATAVQASGRYGTADPPDGAGLLDKAIDVNLFNPADQVSQWASAFLNYYQQVARFGSITVDLDAHPELIAACDAVDIGMFIRVTGRTPDPLLFMVVRVSGKDQRVRRTITFDTVPGEVFNAGYYDGDAEQRYDSDVTTLKAAATSSATAVTFRTTSRYSLWDTTAEPYDVLVAGERWTVTAMGAASLVSGAYDQAATVVRSVNGVVKAQAAGAQIRIATPGRYAL